MIIYFLDLGHKIWNFAIFKFMMMIDLFYIQINKIRDADLEHEIPDKIIYISISLYVDNDEIQSEIVFLIDGDEIRPVISINHIFH